MYIVVEHRITNRHAFMTAGQELLGSRPSGLQAHQFFPSADGSRAVCLWEANSVDDVRGWVESKVGTSSDNGYFAVSAEQALGLPRQVAP